jgi:murein DD-endopeptidase MepM/ murein hydrolase activator NlpD
MNGRLVRSISKAGAASLVLAAGVLSSTAAQAQAKYRLPFAYIPYNITAWMDHWRAPFATNTNIRYDGTVITSSSQYYYGNNPRHRGTDFGAPSGTSVYAAAGGTVSDVQSGCAPTGDPGCGGELGNHVWIRHSDGWYTLYAHLSSVNVVLGQKLTCVSGPGGTLIGLSGRSGRATGPHLHFEIRSAMSSSGTSRDPFSGGESQSTEYWYQYALVADPLRPGYQMHYPTTTCQP